jgi:hypothetical protein
MNCSLSIFALQLQQGERFLSAKHISDIDELAHVTTLGGLETESGEQRPESSGNLFVCPTISSQSQVHLNLSQVMRDLDIGLVAIKMRQQSMDQLKNADPFCILKFDRG